MNTNDVAPCGIDCVNCELFRVNDQKEVWAQVALRMEKKAEEVVCDGCRKNGGCSFFSGCQTLACVNAKGHDFCYECAEFPCKKLMPLAEGAQVYPHNLKVFNLSKIKSMGLERFLEESGKNRFLYYKGKFKMGAGPQEPVS